MSLPENLQFDPDGFSGIARLFPLPNLVLFPHVLQPLHIFEPRYRDLLEAAVADDRLITMTVLAPGWEPTYDGRPTVEPIACLGQIATHVRLPDGKYNVLLAGVARVRLGSELPATTAYRQAPAKICVERYPAARAAEREPLTRRLLSEFRGALPNTQEAQGPLAQLLNKNVDLGVLTDIVAYTLDLDVACKAELLAECDIHARAVRLLEILNARASRGDFPPRFSAN
jgi:uncharacterized protein